MERDCTEKSEKPLRFDEYGFTLVELMAVIGILSLLIMLALGPVRGAFQSASLAVSANNIRQLSAGSMTYLGDNEFRFWRYREVVQPEDGQEAGVRWWFGFETLSSLRAAEGERQFDPDLGPLAGYVPAGLSPDPSFGQAGRAFKPKYRFGYIGIGYNVLLADHDGHAQRGWMGRGDPARLHQLNDPEQTVIFATSAQVNNFQRPATPRRPMIEEFYGIDDQEKTVHFRHNGRAMVAFANGASGLLEMHPDTLDQRAPDAQIGRFAPRGNARYLR